MPDSPEYRISQLEQAVAGLRAQVTALAADSGRHEVDIRGFASQVIIQARFDEKLQGLQAGLKGLRDDIAELHAELDAARRDREQMRREMEADRRDRDRVREAREEKERERERHEQEVAKDREIAERRDKIIRWLTLAALAVAAVSSTAAVIGL
jgi:chromosome segregation ATPase